DERSAAEREAARLERERRRAQRRKGNGAPPGALGRDTAEHEAVPAGDELESVDHDHFEHEPFEPYVMPGAEEYELAPGEGEADEHADGQLGELPSGTKRVKGARRVRLRGERPDGVRMDRPGRGRIRRRHSWRVRV